MKDKILYLKYIPVDPTVYEQLQKLWSCDLLDYCEHTPREAVKIARQLGLLAAISWIDRHPDEYAFGQYRGQWRLAGKFIGEVICQRFNPNAFGPSALTNVKRSVVHHSPSGHEWSYGGSGPADLALDILNWFMPPNRQNGRVDCWIGKASRKAWNAHQQFKRDAIAKRCCEAQIARLPYEGGILSKAQILDWLKEAVGRGQKEQLDRDSNPNPLPAPCRR